MAWVYILKCADGSYYVGSTTHIHARVSQHASGIGARYTAQRLPVELVFAHECERIEEAFALEKQIQGWSRAKREALIEGRFDLLRGLSRKDFSARRAVGTLDLDTRRPSGGATRSPEGGHPSGGATRSPEDSEIVRSADLSGVADP
jgi:putative endonuclease